MVNLLELLKEFQLSPVLREKLDVAQAKIDQLELSSAEKDEQIRNLQKKLDDCEGKKPLPKADRGGGGSWVKSRHGRS